jgi:hypothetical protein
MGGFSVAAIIDVLASASGHPFSNTVAHARIRQVSCHHRDVKGRGVMVRKRNLARVESLLSEWRNSIAA